MKIYILQKYFLGFLLFLLSINVQAQSSASKSDTAAYKWERFSITLGGFFTSLDNSIYLGSDELGVGATIDIEDALGLETRNIVFRSDLEYNFGKRKRSGFTLGYFGFFRSAKKVMESEIDLGGITHPIGTEIISRFDLQTLRLAYDYKYFKEERVQLGASLGLFIMPVNFSAESTYSKESATDFIAPLPVLGLNMKIALTPKFMLKQTIEILYISTDGFKGKINDINIRVEYNPFKHFGLGLGYNYFQMVLEVQDRSNDYIDFIGSISTGYTGLMLYGKYFF